MSKVYMMVTITNRSIGSRMLSFYKENELAVNLNMLGAGTANSDVLDYFGLEATEKAVMFAVVTREMWRKLKRGLQKKMNIDVPGTGIAFIIPFASIGGKKALQFFTDRQNFEKEEESILKETEYELIIVILNQGYSNLVMDAAREKGAGGGTVIHAKGTGMEKAEQFLGVSIAAEKEMIFIVTKSKGKNNIMKAIMEKAGMDSKAKSIVFSLPVTSTAGLRLQEEDTSEEI
ncbi:MAG: P-II family nitrogen regulator [Lachnospiraceae bacterium]|jgi:nitrogen regulatory protein PII|nr:P-II family nitrogen regulator [Lachnospiraceae bacterium]